MKTEFKKIAIIGAAGQIARMLAERVLAETDMELTLAGRNVSQRVGLEDPRITYVDGDMSRLENVRTAIQGADVVYVNEASPALLEPAIAAMKEAGIRRLIVAGVLGVYNEVVGDFCRWNAAMIGSWSPNNNRVIGARLVDESGLDYTYLRLTWLYNQAGNTDYKLIPQGEDYRGAQVTRQAVVQYVMDLLADAKRDLAVSVGVVEPGSEDLPNLYTWLLTDKEKIKQSTNGTTMIHVRKGSMEEREFSFPTLALELRHNQFFLHLQQGLEHLKSMHLFSFL